MTFQIESKTMESGYYSFVIDPVMSSTTDPFTDDDPVVMSISRTGDKGEVGSKGDKGDIGLKGSTGNTGSKGEVGACGLVGHISGLKLEYSTSSPTAGEVNTNSTDPSSATTWHFNPDSTATS